MLIYEICKNKISQDLCSTVTVNQHRPNKLLLYWKNLLTNFFCCIEKKNFECSTHFNLKLDAPFCTSFSLFSIFQLSSTVFAFFCCKHHKQFSFSVLLFLWHCVYSLHTVYTMLISYQILKLLQFEKFLLINPDLSFWKKVRHRIHHIFDNGAENKIFKIMEISVIGPWMANISASALK